MRRNLIMVGQFNNWDGLAIIDDTSWVWAACKNAVSTSRFRLIKLPANLSFRENWKTFHAAKFILVHWENSLRPSGALLEEILEVDHSPDPTDRIIIVTSNPIHEDVVYFSELGVTRIVRARNRSEDLKSLELEIKNHVDSILSSATNNETSWRKLRTAIDRISSDNDSKTTKEIRIALDHWMQKNGSDNVRAIEAEAALALKNGKIEEATGLAMRAIDLNPNFFRAWNTLIESKRLAGQHAESYALLQKLQMRNRSSIGRLAAMGRELIELNDLEKAEQFFKSALDRDDSNGAALNGLAEIKFLQNELDTAKNLLARSRDSQELAMKLNKAGVAMVRQEQFSEALEHYTRARYILPDQSLGHQLYYNIALCYYKWGKPSMAQQFITLALIKNPDYEKARKLLELLKKPKDSSASEPEAA